MSDSTWHFIPPPLGMVVREHGAAEICVHVTGNGWKRYDCWWLLMISERWFRNLYTMSASSIHYNHIACTDFTSVTVPAAHEPVTRSTTPTTLTVVWSRPRSSCDPVAHHIATEPWFTVRWPPLLPPSCRRADDIPAGRRATSAPSFFLRGSSTRRQSDTNHSERRSSE